MSVSRRSQTAGRNSCSIVSANVSNCWDRLTVLSCHEFASQFGLAFFYTRKTLINYHEEPFSRKFLLNEKGRKARLAGDRSTVSDNNTSG